jgi:DNA-binding MltR family transcriptional regulator
MSNGEQSGPEQFGWTRLTPEDKEKVFQLFGNLTEYFRLLRKETDRGCAMIVAALLDDKLAQLLRTCMIQDAKYGEEIASFFRGSEPLGSFSSRIKLAHYLNLISRQVRQDLDIIRKIRNDFGHKLEFEDFNTPSIKARCMNLQHDLMEENQNPREKFINAANVLIVFIDFASKHGIGPLGPYSNPRNVEIAVMVDIMNAAARVHGSAV